MADEGGGVGGVMIPIGIEDQLTPELQRIISRARSMMQELGEFSRTSTGAGAGKFQGSAQGYVDTETEAGGGFSQRGQNVIGGMDTTEIADKFVASLEVSLLKGVTQLGEMLDKRVAEVFAKVAATTANMAALQAEARSGSPEYLDAAVRRRMGSNTERGAVLSREMDTPGAMAVAAGSQAVQETHRAAVAEMANRSLVAPASPGAPGSSVLTADQMRVQMQQRTQQFQAWGMPVEGAAAGGMMTLGAAQQMSRARSTTDTAESLLGSPGGMQAVVMAGVMKEVVASTKDEMTRQVLGPRSNYPRTSNLSGQQLAGVSYRLNQFSAPGEPEGENFDALNLKLNRQFPSTDTLVQRATNKATAGGDLAAGKAGDDTYIAAMARRTAMEQALTLIQKEEVARIMATDEAFQQLTADLGVEGRTLSEGQASTLRSRWRAPVSGLGANRGFRRNLGTLGEAGWHGFRGKSDEDENGVPLNPEGKSGLGGAVANMGGLKGVGTAMIAPMTGYAGFMLGMYALNDIAKFMTGMVTAATQLQDALAPLSQTFQELGLGAGAMSRATNTAYNISTQTGMSPSDVIPVLGMAQATYGGRGQNQVNANTLAASQYGVISGGTPTEGYNTLRSIGVPFGQSNLSSVSDEIVATSQKFGVSIQDVSEGLQQVSLAAADSGLSLKQTATIVGKASQDTGLTSSTEGGAFARVLTVLSSNLSNLVELGQEIPSLGKQLTPGVIANDNPGQLLGAIGKANLTPSQQILMAQSLGIGRQDVASLGIFKSVTQTDNGTVGGATNVAGASTREFNAQMSTLDGQMKLVKEDVVDLGTQFVTTLLPALNDFAGAIKIIANAANAGTSEIHHFTRPGSILGQVHAANQQGLTGDVDWVKNVFGDIWHMGSQGSEFPTTNVPKGAIVLPNGTVVPPGKGTSGEAITANQANAYTQAAYGPLALSGSSSALTGLGSLGAPANSQTLQALYGAGWFGASTKGTGQYVGALSGDASTVESAMRSKDLSGPALQQLAPELQQIRQAMASAYQQQASMQTTYGQMIAAVQTGNNQQGALNVELQASTAAVKSLQEAYNADKSNANSQALMAGIQQVASLTNQKTAGEAQALQGNLAATGAVTQAGLMGSPVAQGQAAISGPGGAQSQIALLMQQAGLKGTDTTSISNLQTQAQKLVASKTSTKIDPTQAVAQIGQLEATMVSDQYTQAQTVFQQSQAGLISQQGIAQSRGNLLQVAQNQLTLDTQTLTYLKQYQPGNYLAIANQENTVLQDTVNVATTQAADQAAILTTQASIQKLHGQIVASDQTTTQALQVQLNALLARGYSQQSQAVQSLDQQITSAVTQTNQDFVTTQENHIQAMADIHQITSGQELTLLQELENSPQAQASGTPVLDQIKEMMQSVYNQLANNLQFDLPSDINIEGLYYTSKRGTAVGGTGGYNDNRTITINLGVDNAATMGQVTTLITNTLGTGQQVLSTANRRY